MNTGTITQINKPDHSLHGRSVVVDFVSDGFVTAQFLEEQSFPAGKRRVVMLHCSYLTSLSSDRQLQIANTMGLRLEALPYAGQNVQPAVDGESIGSAWNEFFGN